MAMADGEAVPNGFGEIRFRRFYRFGKAGLPFARLAGNGGRIGATGSVSVGCIDEFSLIHPKESSVVQEIRGRSFF